MTEQLLEPEGDLIGQATSLEYVVGALAQRGCTDLTSSIDLGLCGAFPCAGGGFCDVYQGKLKDGTPIAIKALRIYDKPGEDSDKRKILKRAARELYYWSKLHHPNVLPLLGLAIFRGYMSLVSEWMPHGHLMAYIKSNPNASRLNLCLEICAGLHHIHINEMVHGDLKAANVMVSASGKAMIADFGNAQLKDLTLKFTNTTNASLSIRWAAPELLLDDQGPQVSKEADVYAYGMTALEVFSGTVPYEGLSDNRVLCLVAYENKLPARPSAGVSDDLWAILKSCWIRIPSERPGTGEIIRHLEALVPTSGTEIMRANGTSEQENSVTTIADQDQITQRDPKLEASDQLNQTNGIGKSEHSSNLNPVINLSEPRDSDSDDNTNQEDGLRTPTEASFSDFELSNSEFEQLQGEKTPAFIARPTSLQLPGRNHKTNTGRVKASRTRKSEKPSGSSRDPNKSKSPEHQNQKLPVGLQQEPTQTGQLLSPARPTTQLNSDTLLPQIVDKAPPSPRNVSPQPAKRPGQYNIPKGIVVPKGANTSRAPVVPKSPFQQSKKGPTNSKSPTGTINDKEKVRVAVLQAKQTQKDLERQHLRDSVHGFDVGTPLEADRLYD